jgi:ribosomal 50S subunit-associated protein YjgA (DUF615 family)
MADVLVRDLSEQTIARLTAQALARGLPMQALLKEAIEAATRPSVDERLRLLQRSRVQPRHVDGSTTLDEIRAACALRP